MQKTYSILTIALCAILFFSCAEKPKKVAAQNPKPVVEVKEVKDTVESISTEPIVEKPHKYFLIAESFSNKANAENYKKVLINKGFDAQIIERAKGPNADFYKVAYKSFAEKDEAIMALNSERKQKGFENIWVLIQR